MNDAPSESEQRQVNAAMAVRRWFLMIAAPVILILTLASVAQWRVFWQWLIK